MKNILFVLINTALFSVMAQIPEIKKKDSCYLRYDSNGEVLRKNIYSEWECGKLMGVVDCNQRLEYDEASNIVYMKNDDLVNSAGGNKPFTGKCETCHMNGSIERRVNFVNGKEDGIDTTYYKTGCPQVVRSHIQGLESGQWIYYYDSTQYIAWEMNYMNGEKHGRQIYYTEKGDTTRMETYSNGRLSGVKRTYYPGSKIQRESTYNNGLLDGSFKIYNMDGVIIEELNYKQGKKDGECTYFFDDGKPLKIEHWTMGIRNGESKMFFYDGSIQTSEAYYKGIKEGWFEEFYPDGRTKHKTLYKKNVVLEEYKFDEHGRETYAFPERVNSENEDDEMPTKDKKGKKGK